MFLLHIALELNVYNQIWGNFSKGRYRRESHNTWDMNVDTNEQGTSMISRHLFHSFRMHILL